MKPIRWIGSSRSDLQAFPVDARGEAGFQQAIYVLHCFAKKTRKTSQSDIDCAKRRYGDVVAARRTERT